MFNMAFYWEYVSMSSKTTTCSLELFPFVKQLEEHLDLGPITDWQVLKKHKFTFKSPCLKSPH